MYTPSSFVVTDQETLHTFIEQHSFATVVTHGQTFPAASHLPLLLDRDAGPNGRLIGHMARANPQWKSADGAGALAIFHGPHAYISPSWYESQSVVPTWNYVTVHASGTMRLETDPERLREFVERLVVAHESDMPAPWSLGSEADEFVNRLLAEIVGFMIDIERLEGKWKLNQNHPAERRGKVATGLRTLGGEDREQIAVLMAGKFSDGAD